MENKPSAVSRFGGNSVILRSLGEQTKSRKTLQNLCLTSKLFHFEFSPFLYREIHQNIDMVDEHNPNLAYTKSLHAVGVEEVGKWARCFTTVVKSNKDFSELVQRLLVKMPRLQTFVWPDEEYNHGLMRATIDTLHNSCKRLQNLTIHHWPSESARYFSGPELSAFKNLQHLSVTHVNNDLLEWKAHIVQILRNSPTLQGLDISISCTVIYDYGYTDSPDTCKWFFDRMCDDYAAAGGQPLRLRYLGCGQGTWPSSHSSLVKLTDLEYLEDIDVHNSNMAWLGTATYLYGYADELAECGIVFDAFNPSHCPNLRSFATVEYRYDVHELMASFSANRAFSKKLIVRFDDSYYFDTICMLRPAIDHPALPLSLRMLLGLQLSRYGLSWYDGKESEKTSAAQVLNDLVSSNADSLEGLTVDVEETCPEASRQDPRPPSENYSFRSLEELEAALTRLPHLTQLGVNTERRFGREAVVGNVSEDKVLDAARRLALASHNMVYISIYARYWRIRRQANGDVHLVELEEWEWKDVELFYYAVWKPHIHSRGSWESTRYGDNI